MIESFKGEFITEVNLIKKKLQNIKAFVFDWDGVFNNGAKDANGCSTFSEIDSMGINLLRFNHFLQYKSCAKTAIITGENNQISMNFARREHFDQVYYQAKNKRIAIEHFCKTHQITPEQIAFFFDDVLDFNVAEIAGLRIMIKREATPLLKKYVIENNLVDYITHYPGDQFGIREATEMIMGLSGLYNDTITHRMNYTTEYSTYIGLRNSVEANIIGPSDL